MNRIKSLEIIQKTFFCFFILAFITNSCFAEIKYYFPEKQDDAELLCLVEFTNLMTERFTDKIVRVNKIAKADIIFLVENVKNSGKNLVFWVYASICAIAFLFIAFFVPETKGKTLEEIEKSWV